MTIHKTDQNKWGSVSIMLMTFQCPLLTEPVTSILVRGKFQIRYVYQLLFYLTAWPIFNIVIPGCRMSCYDHTSNKCKINEELSAMLMTFEYPCYTEPTTSMGEIPKKHYVQKLMRCLTVQPLGNIIVTPESRMSMLWPDKSETND